MAPTRTKPFVTYRPSPRIITQIHDNGVKGGTIFLTYEHKFVQHMNFNNTEKGYGQVISETEVLYSPLTKEQADYICNLLNAQSKILYKQKMKEIVKAKQINQNVK